MCVGRRRFWVPAGAGGVLGLGGVGEWCRVVRGCCGARFWVFLNVVVCQWVSVFGWCWVGFVGCARWCFREHRMLLWWWEFRGFVFSGCFAVWWVGVYDWEHGDDEAVDARRGAFRDPSPPPQPRSGVGYRFRRFDEFDW